MILLGFFVLLELVPPIKKTGKILSLLLCDGVRDFPGHTVPFGSQLAKQLKNQNFQAELPGNWAIRVRIIGAEVSSFDPSSQVVTQRWDCLADFSDGFLNTFGHGRTRSFGARGSLAVPAPESDRGGEIVYNRL